MNSLDAAGFRLKSRLNEVCRRLKFEHPEQGLRAETEHDGDDEPSGDLQPERMTVNVADDLRASRGEQNQREPERQNKTVDRARENESFDRIADEKKNDGRKNDKRDDQIFGVRLDSRMKGFQKRN